MAQHIEVTPYNHAWPQMYEREKSLILQVLGGETEAIYHIGSTAVPGLAAKPIIDIMVAVRDIDRADRRQREFEAIGYECLGEFGMPGRRYLRKGGDQRTHQIHIFEEGNQKDILRHLAVRDYLRLHQETRQAYGELKARLAQLFPEDIEGYCDGKDSFVKAMEGEALAWYERTMGAAHLFHEWQETMILSCLQEHMGAIATDGSFPPKSACVAVGDFAFFAGVPRANLIGEAGASLLIPRTGDWNPLIEEVFGHNVKKEQRYAIKKEPQVFEVRRLKTFAEQIPHGYEIRQIDEDLYAQIMEEPELQDLCHQFEDGADYMKRGIGFAAVMGGSVVAGASSYTIYSEGIEIEVDTKKAYRRQGLALACASRLILECLKRGLYPSWDAHDMRSVALAEKLGYHMDRPYTTYCICADK